MQRAATVILALMGGGLVLLSARQSADCRTARQNHRPDADQVCNYSSGHGGGWGGYSAAGWHSQDSEVERGGFGRSFFGRMGG